MKSATVTWITYNNYGTQLQAFALQQFIAGLGITNVIVSDDLVLKELQSEKSNINNNKNFNDYNFERCSDKFKRLFKKYLFHPKACIKVFIEIFNAYKNLLLAKRKERKQRAYKQSQDKFSDFKKDCLNILYNVSYKDLYALNDEFDVFVCGSDQIWSPLDCNFDGYYYLDFAHKKKFSYATSLGTTDIEVQKKEKIQEWTRDFYKLSVRELKSATQLSKYLNRNVEWVLDPTLLFDKTFWNEQRENYPVKKRFIVCYFLEDKAWYISYAKSISNYLGVAFKIIPSSKKYAESSYSFKNGVGPREFVDLITKAEFVLTDSYHASVFSIIFEKNFLYLKRFKDDDPNCQNIRIESLFELLDIKNLIIDEKTFSKQDIVDLNYSKINKAINEKESFHKIF